ncbi:MAG: hypothetical protein GY915_07520 [bacterium]|nr:hypothetical protein [bacterium]
MRNISLAIMLAMGFALSSVSTEVEAGWFSDAKNKAKELANKAKAAAADVAAKAKVAAAAAAVKAKAAAMKAVEDAKNSKLVADIKSQAAQTAAGIKQQGQQMLAQGQLAVEGAVQKGMAAAGDLANKASTTIQRNVSGFGGIGK